MRDPKFSFTITDAARFLNKSPVTLRKWERQGFFDFPRVGEDRRVGTLEMRALVRRAREAGRITEDRLRLVEATLTLLELVEGEDRSPRSPRSREE